MVTTLAIISYTSGIIGYLFGAYLNTTQLFWAIKTRYLKKYDEKLNQFGGYLILIAAFTPLPFSAVCMMTGATQYSLKKLLWLSTSRFLRFWIYAWIIWEANMI